ncbi:hypothetical protein ACWGHM_36415 [Streptomyces sp. NPDC054904]|uniref:hypothetical protein n=1 Tax=unclassified Streptomyces TaxID=2593676 RepID=UPI002481F2E5|nr:MULTISPECIES: hypothetical protein [unclassified Streptomyces]MDA5279536.1 hypothetical protein [Streptomyces sp. Isolate_45]MDX2392803.1 hypothetical protein [Streptomyces sp. DK15]
MSGGDRFLLAFATAPLALFAIGLTLATVFRRPDPPGCESCLHGFEEHGPARCAGHGSPCPCFGYRTEWTDRPGRPPIGCGG